VYAELDYSFRRARRVLGRAVGECNAIMVRTREWKYVHWQGFRPQLFALADDPHEFIDRGDDPRYDAERRRLATQLFDWLAARKRRTTMPDAIVDARTDSWRDRGVHFGIW
jgi:arylsulfatase A-like enzyme